MALVDVIEACVVNFDQITILFTYSCLGFSTFWLPAPVACIHSVAGCFGWGFRMSSQMVQISFEA